MSNAATSLAVVAAAGGGIGDGKGCGGDGGSRVRTLWREELARAATLDCASPMRVPGACRGQAKRDLTAHATLGSTRACVGATCGKHLSELMAAPQKARKSTTRREPLQACARACAPRLHGVRGNRSTHEQPAWRMHGHLGGSACSLPQRAQMHACQAETGRGES